MALADSITATATILGTVTGIGNVHAYTRWGGNEAAFKALFVSSGKIHGWSITREASSSIDYAGSSLDTHSLVMHGYMSLDDSANTEKTFQDLIEAIRTKFQTNRRLIVTDVPHSDGTGRIQVRLVDHRMFGGILCHHAELVLEVQDFV